jgi:hypothetical protein
VTTELVPTPPSVEPEGTPTDAVEVDPTAAMAEVILQTRRAVVPAIVLGVVGLVVGVLLGELLAAVGFCIGLGLGMFNARMLRQSVQRRFEILVDTPGAKTHFLAGGAARLGLLTLVTLAAVILVRPLGFGMILGMVAFQITLLVFSAAAMLKSVRA